MNSRLAAIVGLMALTVGLWMLAPRPVSVLVLGDSLMEGCSAPVKWWSQCPDFCFRNLALKGNTARITLERLPRTGHWDVALIGVGQNDGASRVFLPDFVRDIEELLRRAPADKVIIVAYPESSTQRLIVLGHKQALIRTAREHHAPVWDLRGLLPNRLFLPDMIHLTSAGAAVFGRELNRRLCSLSAGTSRVALTAAPHKQ
jgi:lysophospholipase L1-like esterase